MNFDNWPDQVKFCNNCVMSNNRPSSIAEFKHNPSRDGSTYLNINLDGECDACKQAKIKNEIDWKQREEELCKLLDKFRSNDSKHDCLVPGSGGKDSAYQSHILKTKYGMNPLTITWPPALYTDYGYKNFLNWINIGGFDNVTFRPNGDVFKRLTSLAIENLLHPFQTFILGQKNLAPKLAKKFGINLIFYGENEAEYGNPLAENSQSLRDNSYFTYKEFDNIYLSGINIKELINEYNFKYSDLEAYLPMNHNEYENTDIEVHYLGYYLKWTPQEVYYYATENTGFSARPFRTQGSYSKYNSIDDKIDDLHYYTTFIKFGIGRATYDASQEIRNKHITREEACSLVKQFDGEFPDRYFKEILDYFEINESFFYQLIDKFRPPHIWKKINNKWLLRHTVNNDGADD